MHPRCSDVAAVMVVVAARTAPGERERLHDVHPVVCAIDCDRRRFDWFAGPSPDAFPGHEEDERLVMQVIEELVDAAAKETNWWRNATSAASDSRSERLHCGWRGFLADFSGAIDTNASEVLRVFTVLDTAALLSRSPDLVAVEAAIARLLAKPRAMRSLQRRVTDSVHKVCVVAIHEVLRRHTLVLEQAERFDGTFQSFMHNAKAAHCMRFNPSAASVFAALASSTPHQSMFGMISRACSTKQGRKSLQKWIDRPCADAQMLRARQDIVHTFVQFLRSTRQASSQDTSPLDQLARFFRHFQAFESKLEAFAKMHEDSNTFDCSARPSLSSFVDLAQWIHAAKDMTNGRVSSEENAVDPEAGAFYFASLHHHVARLLPLCTLIQQVVEPPTRPSNDSGDDEAMTEDSPASAIALRDLRSEIQQCKDEISVAVSQAAVALHLQKSRIRILYDEDDQPGFPTTGVVLRISRQDGHRVHQHNGKLVTIFKASRATGVWFTVPSIDRLGARWKVLKGNYDASELELVRLIVSAFHQQYRALLSNVIREAGELDVLMAFALVSNQHGFARADVSDSSAGSSQATIEIITPFSPFVSDKQHTQEWSIRIDESHRFLLLEGEEVADDVPLLHLVGMIAVLNQIGCFVPCASARLPLFDAVLLRGGAYDQQLYGFSAFMTEMKEMALVLENMTSKSLVLIDDLCRGTASSEGLALALSVCSHLIDQGAFVCFSSQWRELTSQVEALQGVTLPISHRGVGAVSSPERRRREEDRRWAAWFGQLLVDSDMPRELMGLIQQELEH